MQQVPSMRRASALRDWATLPARVLRGSPFRLLPPRALCRFRLLQSRRSHRQRSLRRQRPLLRHRPGEHSVRTIFYD